MMCMLIALTVITVMSHEKFAVEAGAIRNALSAKIAAEVVADGETRAALNARIAAIPVQRHQIGVDRPLSRKENLDTPYMKAAA